MTSSSLPQTLWKARVPLYIIHPNAPTASYIMSIPRFSYLSLLLPQLSLFFNTSCSSFHFEDVQLRNLAVGLLLDLYQPSLPWRLEVNDGVSWDIADTFLNCAKEADFIRNGNANQIMKMSKDHTTQLWNAVIDNDYTSYNHINTRLLNAPTALKHIPMRIYLPTAPILSNEATPNIKTAVSSSPPPPNEASGSSPSKPAGNQPKLADANYGSFRVVQKLVPAISVADRRPKLLGQALRDMMPALFPSTRDAVLAQVVMHGAPVPFDAPLDGLMREAAYPDGWLCLVVRV